MTEKYGKLGSTCPLMNQDLSGHDLFLQASSTWEACGNYHNLQGQEKSIPLCALNRKLAAFYAFFTKM